MKKTYERPACEVYRVAMKHRLCEGSLQISNETATDAGWAKQDIYGETYDEPQRQSLWED